MENNELFREISAYKRITKYILEQEAGAIPPPQVPAPEGLPNEPVTPAGEVSPIPPSPEPQPIDVAQDDEVTQIDSEGVSMESESPDTEELDITDLVNSQKTIQDKQEEYFNNLFGQINKLEDKLKEMDGVLSKLDALERKIEQNKPKTPQEKLELRTLDSGPFTQKLTDFFDDKQSEMKKSGKNEYVLTSDDITDINPREIKDTFNDYMEDDDEDKIIEL